MCCDVVQIRKGLERYAFSLKWKISSIRFFIWTQTIHCVQICWQGWQQCKYRSKRRETSKTRQMMTCKCRQVVLFPSSSIVSSGLDSRSDELNIAYTGIYDWYSHFLIVVLCTL
uniref:Uncharacterized protein n=1 Tax=Oryza barthii TaxID=65489 RepID=A0A0D3HB32_9ORYZ